MRFTIVNRGDEKFAYWLTGNDTRCDYCRINTRIDITLDSVNGLGKLTPRYWFCSEVCMNIWVLQNTQSILNDKKSY
jgi:hypothetical protein